MDRQLKSYTVLELAERTKSHLVGDPKHLIDDVADLESATSSDASFLANPKYLQEMKKSQAGVICVHSQIVPDENKNYLVSDNPSQTFQNILELFHPPRKTPSGFTGIHTTATIHPTACLSENVTVGPHAVIDEFVHVGEGSFIGAGVYVGPNSSIGNHCLIHPRVVIRESCSIGDRVIIQPGAIIGSCGFGYATDAKGIHTKLNQVGDVVIEDDVEIGSNTTIDRARFKSTLIGRGSKIDNLVQIAHGVVIGPHNIIVAQTGIAGSTSTGGHVVIGGQVAVAGHIHLDKGVMIAGKSGVSKSLSAGKYGGIPVQPLAEYNRNAVFLRNIEAYVKQMKELEKRIAKIEGNEQG
jgi:UDP-3-O-[3-hydroxymyristoyl] glucosamine N-acyltransferase